MIVGTVSGNVVATRKHDKLGGRSLLLVQPTALDGTPHGDEVLALDTVGAGVGDRVLVVIEGRSTSQAIEVRSAPANAAIVAIVDEIDIDQNALGGGRDTAAPEGERPKKTTSETAKQNRGSE
jgi:ethanolamine utilization protein EutN